MAEAWDDLIVVGVIVRTHGLRGEVVVAPETDFPDERFAAGATVLAMPSGAPPSMTPRRLVVTAARAHKGRLLVAFEGLERIEDAEALLRAELRVPPSALRALPEGQYYHHDLVGCEVVTVTGEPVGRVARVDDAGMPRLVVIGPGGHEVLVPLAADICVDLAVSDRRIVVAPPDGLLELNRGRPAT